MDASNRRLRTIAAGLSLAGLALAGCSNSTRPDADAKSVDGWSRAQAGTTLNVIAEATANSGILEELLPDFEKKTGINVRLEQAPYDSLVQKAVLDFTTKKGNYDVLSIPYEYLGSFAEKKYLRDMDDFVAQAPEGVGNDYSSDDIIPGLWQASSKWKDHWYGAPSNSAVMMIFYRSDLMESQVENLMRPRARSEFVLPFGTDVALCSPLGAASCGPLVVRGPGGKSVAIAGQVF